MNIETKIETFIRNDLLLARKKAIGYDESLISSGILDSLTLLQMIAYLEEEFGITIGDGDMDPANFETIRDMAAFVQSKSG
jgi:acyl carrier protein